MEEKDFVNKIIQANTKLPENINQTKENSNLPYPAVIDLNIINISSINNYSLNNIISNDNIPSINQNDLEEKNLDQDYSNVPYYEKYIEKEKEKIRKASCDIGSFEYEQRNEKENQNKKLSEDSNSFSRNNEENERNIRTISPQNIEKLTTEASERIKQCILTNKYKYIGDSINGKRDGFGICEYTKGKVYIGFFKNDKKDGYGKIIYSNGDEEYAEFSNGSINGFYECVKKDISKITGYINDKKFSEFLTLEKNNIIYEGKPYEEESNKISFGKLTIKKEKSKKIFIGNILNYQTEVGFGLFYKDNNLFYGEIKNKVILNYIENYSSEGGCFLGFLKDSKKSGIGISFLKDGRICIGEFEDDQKKGPIFIFTMSKPRVNMDLYLMGFKTKSLEKMETIKKYLQINYPEFCKILKINFDKLIGKITPEINTEISISIKIIESLKNL
jgi:hypothetical protein